MPTVAELAAEFGIDPTALKPEFISRIDGMFAASATESAAAKKLREDAEADLAAAKEERTAIETEIATYGVSSATIAALQANEAAMRASLESMKANGFSVDIPAATPVANVAEPGKFDPAALRNEVGASLAVGINLTNKYQRLYGKPLPDDVDVLAREAAQKRMTFGAYVEQKYDFAGQEQRQAKAAQETRDAEIAKKAVDEYREKNPIVGDNPHMRPGMDSRSAQIRKTVDPKDLSKFSNMSPRQKLQESVSRSHEALAAANQA